MTPEKLKQARLTLNITQEEMAHRVGVTYATWNRWENNVHKPQKIYIEKIESLLRVIP